MSNKEKDTNEQSESNYTKVNSLAPELTVDNLFKALIQLQEEAAKDRKALAEAIIEGRKPYVDPQVLKAKQDELEEKRRQVRLELIKRQETKRQCPHLRTRSDGSFESGKLNIKWMEHSNGIILGVCGTCYSQFDARNPADLRWLQADGMAYNQMGRARDRSTAGIVR